MGRKIQPGNGGGPRALPFLFRVVVPLLLFVSPSLAGAQTIQGQVVDRRTLAPVEGVLAILMDAKGRELDGALTNVSGRFILRAPGPGTYTIQTDRIGYESVTSHPFSLEAGQIFGLRLETSESAIQLEELRVEGEQQCIVRPEEGMEVARVWEEARKGLTIQEWTEREGIYRFQIVSYERDLDRDTRQIQREDRRVTTNLSRNPIQSLPVEDLMADGFIRELEDGSLEYYGPDASVLLSDAFLDTHCFRLAAHERRPSSIGLAFEPVRRGAFRDVMGTLWLDRETGALQRLEYGYTWSRYAEAQGLARGQVDFRELPNGAWIVEKWWIRMPILAQDLFRAGGGRTGIYVSGIRETGGEIARISTMDRRTISERERGMVTGLVWDSTRYGPLEGARVYLSGTSYFGITDAQGRFLMEGVPEGVFTAGFIHPRLDTLGILASGVDVEVTPGDLSEVRLAIPSEGSLLVEVCRGQDRRWGSAVLSGVVRDKSSGEVIPGATVRLDWTEVTRQGAGRIGAQARWLEIDTDGEGRFLVCSLPSEELVVVEASFLGQESDTVHVRVQEDSYTVVDLEIELPPGMLRGGEAPSAPLGEGSGTQGVQGFLLDQRSGTPIRSAEVVLEGEMGTGRVTGETDDRGFFRLQTRVPGDFLLSARALGFARVEGQSVEVPPGKLAVLELQMAPEALELEPLLITAEARTFHLEMEGFYQRKDRGLDTGIFLAPEFIEERMPRRTTDLFYGMLGTRVVDTQIGEQGVYFRAGERLSSGGLAVCWPMVYLDRQLIRTGGLHGDPAALNEIIDPFELAAVEVYRSAAEIPPQFNGPNAGCGAIVLWTKRGGSGGSEA